MTGLVKPAKAETGPPRGRAGGRKAKTGRNLSARITLRLYPETLATVASFAGIEQCDTQDLIREAVDQWIIRKLII
jgi:hypothetical protein